MTEDATLRRVSEWLDQTSDTLPLAREPLKVVENYQSRIVATGIQGERLSKKRKSPPGPISTMSQPLSPKKRVLAAGSGMSSLVQNDLTPKLQYSFVDPLIRSASESSSSRTSSRSQSPTKRKADFDMMYPGITFNEDKRTFTDRDWELPDRVRKAAVRIPVEMREHLESHPVARRILDCIEWQEDHSHSLLEIQEFWTKVQKIEEAATVCSREARSEDCWSDDVVLEILRLALTWSGLRNKLMIANLKSVVVDQPALLPIRNLERVVSKNIDYGMCLQPDAEEEAMIENVLRNMSDDLPSISQSAVPMLRKRALFCNLEIKKTLRKPGPGAATWCLVDGWINEIVEPGARVSS